MATFTMYFKDALEFDPSIESEVLANYSLYNDSYRTRLNTLIKEQFWNREIGMETVSMFKLALKRKLDQIMPYYNEQYKTTLLSAGINPLITIDMENTGESTGKTGSTATSDNNSDSNSKSRAVASEFPQTALSGNGDYASSSQDNTSATESKAKAEERSDTEQSGTSSGKVRGTQGQQSALLMQHRQTIVNVDVMLLADLEDLFMQIWSNGDEFTDWKSYAAY